MATSYTLRKRDLFSINAVNFPILILGDFMAIRTDLAVEQKALLKSKDTIITDCINLGRVDIERMKVPENYNEEGIQGGDYVTVSFDKFTPDDLQGDLHSAIKTELAKLLKQKDNILVVGLGNREITPDAVGPLVIENIFATRHIKGQMAEAIGLSGLRGVSALATGVLGQTGIEAAELISASIQKIKPEAVIVIDALAARNINRLGRTVQLTDSGIRPGSGVGNSRAEISFATLGVPTVAIGVPTVVDVATLLENETGSEYKDPIGGGMMVTPRDIDSMVRLASKTIAHAVNCALQPEIESEILLSL